MFVSALYRYNALFKPPANVVVFKATRPFGRKRPHQTQNVVSRTAKEC